MLRWLAQIGIIVALLSCCAMQQARPATDQPPTPALTESDLDDALQKVAEEALGQREGAVIVIDPQNGRLRAVVNPRLAFEQTFPPGSAIKPFTALAAMRAGLIDREHRHQCQTRYARAGFEIVCSHPVSKAPFDLPQALAYSCNDYFARVGERLSEGAFNSTLSGFGFGERTGVNANEAMGELPGGDWHPRISLGESEQLLVTPVQLIAAFAALVNGGHLYRPQKSGDHHLVPQEKIRLNIAPEHRSVLIEGMRGSVKYGTAAKASLSDLPFYVFGKTGTSTSSNRWRTQGWFAGLAADKKPVGVPRAEQVKLGVLVFLKRAHGSQAAEVARPILECGMRNAECGMKKAAVGSVPRAVASEASSSRSVDGATLATARGTDPQSAIRNPQSVRVRSVSENVTRELPVEEYLVGVLVGEASVEDEFEALKAQAVVSRTFALKNRGRHAQDGYDFCSTTHCQRFVMSKAKNTRVAARRAVEETVGEILRDDSRQIADVYFHAACGGITANIETLWGAPAPTYLRGVRDDFCATMPHRRWMQTIPANQLAKALQSDERSDVGAKLESIVVSKRDATGRAEMITIEGSRRRVIRGWEFKLIVGRSLGWQMIKSSRFEVSRAGGDFVFRGGGFGHGLGLCQEGAHVAARRGMDYRQILNHYFPGASLRRDTKVVPPTGVGVLFKPNRIPPPAGGGSFKPSLQKAHHFFESHQRKLVDRSSPTYLRRKTMKAGLERSTSFRWWDSGSILAVGRLGLNNPPASAGGIWENKRLLSSEHFRASFPSNVDMRSVENALRVLESAREDLLRRLERASLRIAEPMPFEVVIHATTADFIAATGQSGWAAGVTRGRKIELQPLPLLRRRGVLNTTLRHEFAHAVIEVLGQSRAPRWLAEGLAIYVAGEAAKLPRIENKTTLSREELERKLARPASVAEMRELYAMAYSEVRALIQAEGEAAVWRRVARFKELSVV